MGSLQKRREDPPGSNRVIGCQRPHPDSVRLFLQCIYHLPLYAAAMGLPLNQVITMVAAVNPAISDLTTFIFLATIPFNLIKLGLNCFVGYLLYTRLLAVYPAVRTA